MGYQGKKIHGPPPTSATTAPCVIPLYSTKAPTQKLKLQPKLPNSIPVAPDLKLHPHKLLHDARRNSLGFSLSGNCL